MNEPVTFIATIEAPPGQQMFVRLECRDRLTVKCRIEMTLENFAEAQFGQPVTARYSEGAEG